MPIFLIQQSDSVPCGCLQSWTAVGLYLCLLRRVAHGICGQELVLVRAVNWWQLVEVFGVREAGVASFNYAQVSNIQKGYGGEGEG